MEEEVEKVLLSCEEGAEEVKKDEEEATGEKKEENVNESLIQAEKTNDKEYEKKGKFFSIFDKKKPSTDETSEEPKSESFSFKKFFSRNEPKPATINDEEKQNGIEPPQESQQQNQSSSRKLPLLSNFLDKFRKGKYDVTDIEMASKAGLASMETLDDSTKDPWSTENGDKLDSPNKPNENIENKAPNDQPPVEKPINIWQSIQSYECSLDDIALIAGIIIFIFLVGLIIIFTLTSNAKQPLSPPVRDGKIVAVTSCGQVEGLLENSAYAFRGIPYAKQPIDDLRFRHAQPIQTIDDCWNGTLKAHNSTPHCLQYDKETKNITGIEDCLTLDIITPEVRYINLLPVIVMIGADDFVNGSPNILRPSTRYARSESVIFVRPNFRMNVFGFIALETISNYSKVPTSGNYALSDIIAALEWIELNIHNFGGDKNSVTLFGYKTGATLATALTASTKANKYFSKVWASSGSFHFPGKKLEESERENLDYAKQFPTCKNLEHWQQQESSDLIRKIPESWMKKHSSSLPGNDEEPSTSMHDWIVLDGTILKEHPEDYWKSDKPKPKIVIGTTAHASYDPSIFKANMTEDDIVKYIEDSKIGALNLTEKALEIYGKTTQGLVSMISDIRIVCPLLVQARSQSNYEFYVVTQPVGEENIATMDSDILAILGRLKTDTPEKRRYFNAMKQFFYHFIYHGKVKNHIIEIQQDVLPRNNYENCDFWISHNVVPHYAAYY